MPVIDARSISLLRAPGIERPFRTGFGAKSAFPSAVIIRPVESKTRTYDGRVGSGRTAGRRGRVKQDWTPTEQFAQKTNVSRTLRSIEDTSPECSYARVNPWNKIFDRRNSSIRTTSLNAKGFLIILTGKLLRESLCLTRPGRASFLSKRTADPFALEIKTTEDFVPRKLVARIREKCSSSGCCRIGCSASSCFGSTA